jgi:hypothetical protein
MGALGAAWAQKAVGQDAAFEKGISKSSLTNLDNLAPISASTWSKKVSRGIDTLTSGPQEA